MERCTRIEWQYNYNVKILNANLMLECYMIFLHKLIMDVFDGSLESVPYSTERAPWL